MFGGDPAIVHDASMGRVRVKKGQNPDQATRRIETAQARSSRVIAVDSVRCCLMLPSPK